MCLFQTRIKAFLIPVGTFGFLKHGFRLSKYVYYRLFCRYDLGVKNATCKFKLFESTMFTQLNCSDEGNKLSKNENIRVAAVYDISPALLVPSMDKMKTYIKVNITLARIHFQDVLKHSLSY